LKSIPTILIALGHDDRGLPGDAGGGQSGVFTLVLLGLFILASGITVLQVAANPLAAALGDPSRSHFA
jgi:FHS family L-fucose permease-like MFS transporter